MIQEDLLQLNSWCKPANPAARTNQPMAGNDDRQGVFISGLANRPGQMDITQPAGELSIGQGLAILYLSKGLPHSFLKLCTGEHERQIKVLQITPEIMIKLSAGLPERS